MSKYLGQLQSYPYSDILGWSNSRYGTFQSCKRKYYYQYYKKFDFKNTSKIYQLAELTSAPLEIGNATHKVLEILLKRLQKTFEPIDHDKLIDYTRRKVFELCRNKTFEDIYYKKRDNIDIEEEIVKPVVHALLNFLGSDRMQWIYEEALVNKDDWIIELDGPLRFGECRIDGIKAYCKVDFMFPIGDDSVHIIDWKTGKESFAKYNTQLHGYAGWAMCMFGLDLEKIQTTVAYLRPDYVEKSIQLNEYDLDNFAGTVKSQTEEMYKFCSDYQENVPLGKDAFPMTEAINFCRTCNFRELCDRI